MLTEKYIRIAKGLAGAIIPGRYKPVATGGTTNSRYCYSIWLRHLMLLHKYKKEIPKTITEIGPGDSLGTGIAALLCGCEKYIALDAFTYGSAEHNLKIFDELVVMFNNRTAIPGDKEYPLLKPGLDDYSFPSHILTDELLNLTMTPERLAAIRKEIASPAASNSYVNYFVPWQPADIANESVDFLFSQSVFQYIDMDLIYAAVATWLKPGGMMAHVIDFSSLGISKIWNGHWTYSVREWKLFCFGKKILLNRSYVGLHKDYLKKYHFHLLNMILYKKEGGLRQDQLAKEFRHLTNDDVETHAVYMLSGK